MGKCGHCGRKIATMNDGKVHPHGPKADRCPGSWGDSIDGDEVSEVERLTQISKVISADDLAHLVEWFAESFDDGWRPTIQSHVRGVDGQFTSPRVAELRERIKAELGL